MSILLFVFMMFALFYYVIVICVLYIPTAVSILL